ncbi:MAG: WD40 repeat domain-containing protein, partial [Saprospiraceae bacterium]|nr:WD40 repeat domain-containing protein [Saprospiraceae bacterium]
MRYLLLILGLLSAQLSFAQSNQVDRRQSAAAAAAAYNIKQQVDCFSSKFDAGNVSVRQGEFQAAINHFEEAKACPDAQNNDRRLQELESLIKYCLERIGSHKSAEKTSEDIATEPTNSAVVINAPGRGKFSISKALRYNTDPNCFAITMNEANRAFRGGYWDDAAKLYRAAKTCADASQPDRESMNNRIEACQNAAIQELERSKEAALFSEQKAISERRVTLATKLANDAMELIRQGNRSLAFRLADCANFYIAPEDNADCMKAMISAKFYSPAFSDNNVIQPPFAYHLAEDPSATAILRFGWLEKELLLYAYFPAGRRMTAWSIPEMTQVFDFVAPTLQDPVSFDISPDGGFLYIGTNFFALPDNQLIELESPGLYCFSQDGKYFYYEDNRAGVIRSVKINSGYSDMQQVKKGTRSKSVAVQEITIPIESKLFSLAADQDFIWLGYEDRVVASRKSSKAAKLGNNLVWKFDASVYGMVINPERRELLINADSVVYYGFLNWSPTSSDTTWISVKKVFNGPLKGYTVGKDTLLGFSIVSKTDVFEGDYSIFAPESNQVMHRFNGSHSLVVGSVAFSSNGHWLATTENGAILLWPIHDSQTKPPVTYETNFDDHLSYDGAYLVSNKQSQLQVYQADQAGKGPIASFDKHPDSALPRGESRYWAVFWVDTNQLMLRNLESNVALKLKTKQFSTDDVTNFTFDPTENKYFAAANSEGLVTVWSLATGNEIASRQFGGFNTQVLYQPGTDRLIVISQKNYSEFAARSSFYFWNFLDPDSKPEPIPLYDYQASLATVSEQGDMIALSDRYTIHVFSLLEGNQELAVINPSANINQIRFRPDGGALAGGCDNGTVITWEPSGGAPKIKFIYNSGGENFLISHMAYTSDGQSLRIGYFGQLATIELNSFDLRESMQSGSRWLNSFTPAQIREYQLETAWQFTGFFERLEDEGDYPLIRSFFHYFK